MRHAVLTQRTYCALYRHAKAAIRRAGERIANEGLPEPVVFAFTGSGNVSQGAQEIFQLLPHEYVDAADLPKLRQELKAGKRPLNKVYATIVKPEHMVKRNGNHSGPFDNSHYYAHPEEYSAIFHTTVAPYVNVIVNGIYWDARFPRLLTNQQLRALRRSGNKELIMVGDITCDIGGSIEFLTKSTPIERPYFSYVPESDDTVDAVHPDGVLMLGVDILPSELPREASQHFGSALLPLLPHLLKAPGTKTQDDAESLPPEWYRACIASHGKLMPRYTYISSLRKQKAQAAAAAAAAEGLHETFVQLKGHLFDTGLINRALDMLESADVTFQVQSTHVRPNKQGSQPTPSKVELIISHTSDEDAKVEEVIKSLQNLVHVFPYADASIKAEQRKTKPAKEEQQRPFATTGAPKRVLILGSGMVAAPAVELLAKRGDVQVTIASNVEREAQRLVAIAPEATRFARFSFPGREGELAELLKDTDVVMSLLPATMHVPVAKECIKQNKHLVTASYVSPEMQSLDAQARSQGVALLNEMGLDPGIDHMMIMQTLDGVAARGGRVTGLQSVCGGLPDVSAANNPFLYKFSWSPRGVLTAAQNSAVYRRDGSIVEVPSEMLLRSAAPFEHFPTLKLEVLPNRDSLKYAQLYGVPDVKTIFRGTLRYQGWSNVMYAVKAAGLITASGGPDAKEGEPWASYVTRCAGEPKLLAADGTIDRAALARLLKARHVADTEKAVQALAWLGVLGTDPVVIPPTSSQPIDVVCARFTEALALHPSEHDLVAMHHIIDAEFDDGSSNNKKKTKERHTSWLLMTGDDRHTAMAQTVGYTAAAGAELLLAPDVVRNLHGVHQPFKPEVYQPVLERLTGLGLKLGESVETFK